MHLTYREGAKEDFEEWFEMECACSGRDGSWRANALYEWNVFFDSKVMLSLVVEDCDRSNVCRMVAFAGGVFVSDRFIEWLREGQSPYVLIHATHPLPDGSWPLLNRNQLREENSTDGMNLLFTHWTWARKNISTDDELKLRVALNENFIKQHGGYKLKQIVIEGLGEASRNRIQEAGFFVINDYRTYYQSHPAPSSKALWPYLLAVTREQAGLRDGASVCRSFVYTPPRFYFTDLEQEFLALARSGKSDRELMEALCLSLGTCKKRWRTIYERVEAVDSTILPASGENVRGPERRGVLIEYLREHPEELRPVNHVKKRISPPPKRRIAGPNPGAMVANADFDAPLPNDFWTGS